VPVSPPFPERAARWALFLDLDGTLAELAAHPDEVDVPPDLLAVLASLESLLDGALAVVSGRRIDSVDRLLHPARPAAAGLHGLERRNGASIAHLGEEAAMDAAREDLGAFAAAHPGLLLEDKGGALALHYRNAPQLGQACREHIDRLARRIPGHHVLAGKMVFELKPASANKGEAIRAFLEEPPFRDRVPVFAGDDVTDEDGFRWVNDHGGISIKVGEGESRARYRVADVAALRGWLGALREHLEAARDPEQAP